MYYLVHTLIILVVLSPCNSLGTDCRDNGLLSISCTNCINEKATESDLFSLPVGIQRLSIIQCPMKSLDNQLFNFTELEYLEIDAAGIKVLEESAFSRNTKLKTLLLTNNEFKLNPGQFSSLRKLERLDLSNNDLQGIPENVFDNTSRLQNLSIGYNALKEILPQWFYNLDNLIYLDISSSNITELPNAIFNYIRNLEQFIFHDSQNVQNFTIGKEFLLLKSLKVFSFTDVGENPVHLNSEFFSHLRNCPIEMINLTGNNINKVENDTFKYLPRLTNLIMDFNNLSTSEIRNIFLGLNVEYLHLFSVIDNKIGNVTIEASLFDGLRQNNVTLCDLVMINLNIGNITDEAFVGTHINGTINLQMNNIKSLNASTFEGLGDLKALILRNNTITKINAAVFDPLVRLEYLDLSENLLNNLISRLWMKLHNLKTLYLMQNRIEKIPSNAFADMKLLQYLNLYGNGMQVIEDSAFNGSKKLGKLILSQSAITHINPEMFGWQENLRYLSFEDCYQLTSIPGTAPFRKFIKLSDLSFQSCFNLKINYKIFQNISNLNYLQLDNVRGLAEDTSVITDPDAFRNTNLKYLYGSWLNISSYPESLYYLNITQLDLSFNRIEMISSKIVNRYMYKYLHLRTFLLDHNPYYCRCDLFDYVQFLNLSLFVHNVQIGTQDDYICQGPLALIRHPIFDLDNKMHYCFNIKLQVPIMVLIYPFIILILVMVAISILSIVIRKYLFKSLSKQDYEYDAYISYSNMDYNLIYDCNNIFTLWQQLDDEIEDGKERFKLVIRDRDFVIGHPFENIHCFMRKSKKHIYILSDSYLINEDPTEWCNTEMNFGFQMMKYGDLSNIIFIVKEPLTKTVPKWLKLFMRDGVCLTWPTSRIGHFMFWANLGSLLQNP